MLTSFVCSPTAQAAIHLDDPVSERRQDADDRETRTCALLRRAEHAHDPERTTLRDAAIELNLPLADSLARRYRDRGEELEDLVQVARLGLVNAVERYKSDRGDFTVYAVPTMTFPRSRTPWQRAVASIPTRWTHLRPRRARASKTGSVTPIPSSTMPK